MRRAFTLIELLVIVAILATMVTIGVGSIRSGQGAARVKGATRDVYAAIRHARSVALVTGQRVIVKYANEKVDGESVAKIEVISAKLMRVDENRPSAQPYESENYKDMPSAQAEVKSAKSDNSPSESNTSQEGGETIEEVLFAPMDEEIIKGMHLKVVKGDVTTEDETEAQKSHRISVSSNVDWLLKIYKGHEEKKKSELSTKESETAAGEKTIGTSLDEMSEPVSVVWQTNGAVEPHDVWIYADGQKPEDGLLLRIDRFGAVKVEDGEG